MSWRGKGARGDGLCITDVVLDAVLAAQRGDWRWIKLDWDGMGWMDWEESFCEGHVEMSFRYHWETDGA
jgi:hypothetical protein